MISSKLFHNNLRCINKCKFLHFLHAYLFYRRLIPLYNYGLKVKDYFESYKNYSKLH